MTGQPRHMSAVEYRWELDAFGSFAVAIAVLREQGVRAGKYEPQDETEARWAREGVRPVAELEAGRG